MLNIENSHFTTPASPKKYNIKGKSSLKKKDIILKYHRMLGFYRKQLDTLCDNFTPKEATEVGLDKGILTKLRHRGFLKRVQLGDGIYEWIKVYEKGKSSPKKEE